MAVTYNDLYLKARRKLRNSGIENYQLEARELVCCAAERPRDHFFSDLQLYVRPETELKLDALLERRLAGEPLAYILGEWDFYGLTFQLNRDVLIPRQDTEVLAEEAVRMLRERGGESRVLDLCAGCGCIGLSIAYHTEHCSVTLCDISDAALRICRINQRKIRTGAAVTCLKADALGDPPEVLGVFDMMVCNPPYIRRGELASLDVSVRDYEPMLALDGGPDGLDFYRSIAARWRGVLRAGGWVLFEIGIGQAIAVEQILLENGFVNVSSLQDTQGIWRVVKAEKPNC